MKSKRETMDEIREVIAKLYDDCDCHDLAALVRNRSDKKTAIVIPLDDAITIVEQCLPDYASATDMERELSDLRLQLAEQTRRAENAEHEAASFAEFVESRGLRDNKIDEHVVREVFNREARRDDTPVSTAVWRTVNYFLQSRPAM
jgi:hypothetical protein